MKKRIWLICGLAHLMFASLIYAADVNRVKQNKQPFDIVFQNSSGGTIDIITKRTDPLNEIFPTLHKSVQPGNKVDVQVDSPFVLVTTQDGQKMAFAPLTKKIIDKAQEGGKVKMSVTTDKDKLIVISSIISWFAQETPIEKCTFELLNAPEKKEWLDEIILTKCGMQIKTRKLLWRKYLTSSA